MSIPTPDAPDLDITVVVGNPKAHSRTWDAAHRLADGLGASASTSIDVVDLGPGLLGWGDPTVKAAVQRVASSDVVVFASPTFKATYTGLLKLFLDQFDGGTGLRGVVVVPLMLGAGPVHAMAPEVFLRPVLAELGATIPAAALYLIDRTYTEDDRIDDYVGVWGPVLRLATTLTQPEETLA